MVLGLGLSLNLLSCMLSVGRYNSYFTKKENLAEVLRFFYKSYKVKRGSHFKDNIQISTCNQAYITDN